MRKKLSEKDEKLFLKYIHSKPIYTLIDGTFYGIEGKFIRDSDNVIAFIHNDPYERHGGNSDDPKAQSGVYGYAYSWVFTEKHTKGMFSPDYLDEVTISYIHPLKTLKFV